MTTNHEIARLRVMARRGVSKAEAARAFGHTRSWIAYWSEREQIAFHGFRTVHPAIADLALARLHTTMMRMRKQDAV